MLLTGGRGRVDERMLSKKDDFGGEQHDVSWRASELNIEFVPLAHIFAIEGISHYSVVQLCGCGCSPNLGSGVNNRVLVPKHVVKNLVDFDCN